MGFGVQMMTVGAKGDNLKYTDIELSISRCISLFCPYSVFAHMSVKKIELFYCKCANFEKYAKLSFPFFQILLAYLKIMNMELSFFAPTFEKP
jgi:hypothetical protein